MTDDDYKGAPIVERIANMGEGVRSFQEFLHDNAEGSCDVTVTTYDEASHMMLVNAVQSIPLEYEIKRYVPSLQDPMFVLQRRTTAKFFNITDTEDAMDLVGNRLMTAIHLGDANLVIGVNFYRSDGRAMDMRYSPAQEAVSASESRRYEFACRARSEVAPAEYTLHRKMFEMENPSGEINATITDQVDGFISEVVGGLSNIPRYVGTPRIRTQSVLEHTASNLFTAMGLSQYFNEIGIENDLGTVLAKVMLHDVAEIKTGDLPRPAKDDYDDASAKLREALRGVERRACGNLFGQLKDQRLYHKYMALATGAEQGDVETSIAKLADIIDVVRYSKSEVALGNTNFIEIERMARQRMSAKIGSILSAAMEERKALMERATPEGVRAHKAKS